MAAVLILTKILKELREIKKCLKDLKQ